MKGGEEGGYNGCLLTAGWVGYYRQVGMCYLYRCGAWYASMPPAMQLTDPWRMEGGKDGSVYHYLRPRFKILDSSLRRLGSKYFKL